MRVALVANAAPPRNAVGNLTAEKAAFFKERGAEVRVFAETTHCIHPQLRAIARRAGPDLRGPAWDYLCGADLVVFCYSQAFALLDWLPALAGGRPRLVVEYLGVSPPDGWPGPQRELLERGLRQRGLVWFADAALTLSRFTADELAGATGYPRGRITVLEPPLDLDRWRPADVPRPARRTLLFVGRLAPNKRLGLAVEALARLPGPPAELWVVGEAGDVYADEARRARARAAALGVADRVRWLGAVADADLPGLFRQADVLVQPSVHEGFGLPVREAQACGTPVVAARAASLPETVGDAGLTFAPDDLDDFVRQLERALEPTVAAGLRQRGLERARGCGRDRWREAFGVFVEKVLDAGRQPLRRSLSLTVPDPVVAPPWPRSLVLSVHVENQGDVPALAEGPAAVRLGVEVRCAATAIPEGSPGAVVLPAMILPRRAEEVAFALPLPGRPGRYTVRVQPRDVTGQTWGPAVETSLQIGKDRPAGGVAALLDAAEAAAADALANQTLPDDYADVSTGLLGRLKAWVKAKLLHNFRRGYVDVLSRRQTHVNRRLVEAVHRLAVCCRALDEEVRRLRNEASAEETVNSR